MSFLMHKALTTAVSSTPSGLNPSKAEFIVNHIISRLAAFALLTALAACGGTPSIDAPPQVVAGYEGIQDGEFYIEPVSSLHLTSENIRREVAYNGSEKPGTIVVDPHSRKLYHVMEGGRAMRYAIAVGREGLGFTGSGTIQRKAEWPSWRPTNNMIRTQPELYAQHAAGMVGGLDNPLGARALYLYRGGRDTMFRIHGTVDNASIGRATSAGCIRLFNQDAIHLYENVGIGTAVKVRSLQESIAMEGAYMDDAWGRAVPASADAEAQKAKDEILIAQRQQKEAQAQAAEAARLQKEAEKADKKRLSACKRNGITADLCPPLEQANA